MRWQWLSLLLTFRGHGPQLCGFPSIQDFIFVSQIGLATGMMWACPQGHTSCALDVDRHQGVLQTGGPKQPGATTGVFEQFQRSQRLFDSVVMTEFLITLVDHGDID